MGIAQQPRNELLSLMTAYPVLSAEDEMRLATKICAQRELLAAIENDADGSDGWRNKRLAANEELTRLRDEFFYSNVKFILEIIKRMSRVEHDDMFQFGALGLMRAIDLYDPALRVRGAPVRFSTYAKYWIKQSIQRGCDRTESTIVLPVHVRDTLKKLRREGIRFVQEHGRQPELAKLCEYAGLDHNRIEKMLSMTQTPTSLDQSGEEDGETPAFNDVLEEQVRAPDILDVLVAEEDAKLDGPVHLLELLAKLRLVEPDGHLQAEVLECRYFIGEGPAENGRAASTRTIGRVSALLGISRSEVTRLQRAGMEWLRSQGMPLAEETE